MLIYISYFILIGFSALSLYNIRFEGKLNNRNSTIVRSVWCLVLFFGLFFIMALRHPSMGVDLQYGSNIGYIGRFQFISYQSWDYLWNNRILSYEKGYVIFNKLISYISNNEQWYLAVCAFVSLLPIFIIYNKYSDNLPLAICVYMGLTCYSAVFSAIRQAIAIGICFISYFFIKERRIIPFVLLILLAFTFHASAIFFLIAYPAYFFKIPKKFRFVSLIAVGVIFIFRVPLFIFLSGFLKDNAVIDNNGAITLFLIFVLIYIYCFVFGQEDEDTNGLLNLFLIAIICQVFGNLHNYAGRLGYYFMPFLGLLIPKVCTNTKLIDKQLKNILINVIAISFIGFALYTLYNGGNSWTKSYPWVPFWND